MNTLNSEGEMIKADFTFGPPCEEPEKAEKCAIQTYDWLRCAESWLKSFNDKEKALHCASQAEAYAEDFSDWDMCCDFWIQVLPDLGRSRHCILKAEACNEGDDYFFPLCDSWLRIGEIEKARGCLEKVSDKKQAMAWVVAADQWRLKFDDRDKAKKALLSAEKIAASFFDWVECAEGWHRMGLYKERNRCLGVAGEME